MEIHHYEKSDGCLIPLPTFAQLVREKVQDMVPTAELHIQSRAVTALQLGAEAFLVRLLEDIQLMHPPCQVHHNCT